MNSQRLIEIFKAIVDEFISTAEPVGSKTLADKYNLNYSTATIRNEMMELERLGLIEKTHTSSGRVPSIKGYHYYVEHLLDDEYDDRFAVTVRSVLEASKTSSDDVIKKSCDILSEMTNMTSMALGYRASQQRLEHIKLFPLDDNSAVAVFITDTGYTENKVFKFNDNFSIDDIKNCTNIINDRLKGTILSDLVEKMDAIKPLLKSAVAHHEVLFKAFIDAFVKFANDNVYYSGQSNMMYQPDFADIDRLKELMSMINDPGFIKQIKTGSDLTLRKSDQTKLMWLDDLAIISSKITISQQESEIFLIGPSRMDYDKILSLVENLTKSINEVLNEGDSDE